MGQANRNGSGTLIVAASESMTTGCRGLAGGTLPVPLVPHMGGRADRGFLISWGPCDRMVAPVAQNQ
jgi:hypothetical protein